MTVAVVGVLGAVAASAISSNKTSQTAISQASAADFSLLHRTRASAFVGDGTTEAAIAAGLPPDARGVIDAEMLACSTTPASPICSAGGGDYYRMTLKRLRANGDLEPMRVTDVPRYTAGDSSWTTWSAQFLFRRPEFDATLARLYQINASGDVVLSAGVDAVDGQPVRTICYSNGTCDPVTYIFWGIKSGSSTNPNTNMTLISVSMTGSIVSRTDTFTP